VWVVLRLGDSWDSYGEFAGPVVGGGSEVDKAFKSPSHLLGKLDCAVYGLNGCGSHAKIQAMKTPSAHSIVTMRLRGCGNASAGGFHLSKARVQPKRIAAPAPSNKPAMPTKGPKNAYRPASSTMFSPFFG